MTTSQKGVAQIAAEEGIVTKAYRSLAGDWTIGVGHSERSGLAPIPRAGMTITREQALQILAKDLSSTFDPRTAKALPSAPQTAKDGGCSFDFNTGKINSASWVGLYNAGKMTAARTSLQQWNKARVNGKLVVVAGLTNRRKRESNLIFDGRYSDAALALMNDTFKPEIAPSVASQTGQEAEYLDKLRQLGFSGDGAVLTYQTAHPDLVNDGILGPATRTQIDRDLAQPSQPKPQGPQQSLWLALLNIIIALFKPKG